MTNYLYEKFLPDEERIHKLHRILEEHNLTDEYDNERTQPGMVTMRKLQIRSSQLMALIASENRADSTEISKMKMEFLIFWAADDY